MFEPENIFNQIIHNFLEKQREDKRNKLERKAEIDKLEKDKKNLQDELKIERIDEKIEKIKNEVLEDKKVQKALAGLADEYEKNNWLMSKVAFVSKTDHRPASFIPKATHSKDKQTRPLWLRPKDIPKRDEIGTHTLPSDYFLEDMTGGSSAAHPLLEEVLKFLRLKIALDDKKRKMSFYFNEENTDLLSALSKNHEEAKIIAKTFSGFYQKAFSQKPSASKYSKQIYWLKGENSLNDGEYILCQPLFSMNLEKYVSDKRRDALIVSKKKLPEEKIFYLRDSLSLSNLARRPLGGANAQNVSRLAAGIGANILFSNAPPQLKKRLKTSLSGEKDMIGFWVRKSEFLRKEASKETLLDLLKHKKPPAFLSEEAQAYGLRHQKKNIQEAIADLAEEIWAYAFEEMAFNQPGWSASESCILYPYQKFWLDPDREALDADFLKERQKQVWVFELVRDFSREIIDRFKKLGVPQEKLGEDFSYQLKGAFVRASDWDSDLRHFALKGSFEVKA